MGRKRKRKKQECVFCGKIAYTQSDHIPPENLFPKPRPSTLITVPSCPECHRKTTKDDEYFRLMIINREHVAKQPEAKKIIPKIKKSLQRSESRAFSTSFYNSLRTREAFTVNGIYLGNVITCLPNDARIQKVSNRIIKGLFYNLKKIRVPDECKIESCVIQGLIDGVSKNGQNPPNFLIGFLPRIKLLKPHNVGRLSRFLRGQKVGNSLWPI